MPIGEVTVDDLVEGAIAAGGYHQVRPVLHGVPRELRRVTRPLGEPRVDRAQLLFQNRAQRRPAALGFAAACLRVEDDAGVAESLFAHGTVYDEGFHPGRPPHRRQRTFLKISSQSPSCAT